jgi:hypothetical protein
MSPACTAITADATGNVTFRRDAITNLKSTYFAAELNNFTIEFVPDSKGDRNCPACPFVPFIDVDVGAANGGAVYANQYVIVARDRLVNIL